MQGLVRVEIRCREHERDDASCPACRFLQKAERDLRLLGGRRDLLFKNLKQQLASGNLILIDLR